MTPIDTPGPSIEAMADAGAKQRWDDWQARGRARDIRMQRRMRVVVAVVAAGLAASLSWALMRG